MTNLDDQRQTLPAYRTLSLKAAAFCAGLSALALVSNLLLDTQLSDRLPIKLLILALLVLMSLGAGAMFFSKVISRPLAAIETSLSRMASGAWGEAGDARAATDEIGLVALAVSKLGASLEGGKEAMSDAASKQAAFIAASAALMIVDEDNRVVAINNAFSSLVKNNIHGFEMIFPEFDLEKSTGFNIKCVLLRQIMVDGGKAETIDQPNQKNVFLGQRWMSMVVRRVTDAAAKPVSSIIEWRDITEDRLNRTALDALNKVQASAVFDGEGRLLQANAILRHIMGVTSENELVGMKIDGIVNVDQLSDAGSEFMAPLRAGKSVRSTFRVSPAAGPARFLETVLIPAVDDAGQLFRIILLGSDVTEAKTAVETATRERFEMESAQLGIVETLRLALRQLSDGDLASEISQPVPLEYEGIKMDFNKAIEKLRDAMLGVMGNADLIRGEATEISNAAEDLSKRTERQASTLEETATALDQLTASVRSAADGANKANELVGQAKANAENGGSVVRRAVEAMGAIEESSSKIAKITSVIDDIAFQTNLLALNAGVEAARAGDAGRGFAVVASEVRALAQRSSDAAREINDLISASADHVKLGVKLVADTGSALQAIVTSVTNISSQVSEIAMSAREQSSGLAEINVAVNQLDQVTQQNAAMFEQTTAASHALTSEAESLSRSMQKFNTGQGSGHGSDGPEIRSAAACRSASRSDGRDPLLLTPKTRNLGPLRSLRTGATASGNLAMKSERAPVAIPDEWQDF